MCKIKALIFLVMVLIVQGCTVTKTEFIDKPIYHPSRPDPVKTFVPHWEVIVIDSNPFVGLSYTESIENRLWLERLLAYISKQNAIICSYRKELNEEICKDVVIESQIK